MKLRLLILSDLWGFDNAPWLKNYVELLKSGFELIFYNSYELPRIDKINLTEKEIHSQFVNGGIDNAVTKLLGLEKEEVYVLAFSNGGTIAWKAALKGLKITQLYAAPSTRLRYEREKPTGNIQLIFGAKDRFKPENSWFKKLNLEAEIIKNEPHELYKNKDFTNDLCKRIRMQCYSGSSSNL